MSHSNFPGVGTTGTNITISSGTQGILSVATLTDEEKKELAQLRDEHDAEVKAAKLNIFKQLNSEIRQRTIDLFEWANCKQLMDATFVPQNERLAQLTMKESMTGVTTLRAYIGSGTSWYPHLGVQTEPGLPEGITLEDLKKAHVDASLEESIGDGKSNVR